ncbi:OprD family porin [Pseudomonas indica]|uniref:OprD family porin n=1 Tax=Pseudomonas indica TaxID=137658 RepID=UPI000BABE9D7|nr:OprD family porin [Pseudomonas indica]MBU3058075.1 OprD family porin [Pseudomonas indica]PAU57411.1 porin [Pseudomonas indica]
MQVMKWSVIALAVAAGTTQMAVASSQSESKGFIEDSNFKIFNRVLYMNRDFRDRPNTAGTGDNGYREETGLGIRLLYESGFTQGTVGVGVDAHTLSSIKLDSGRGRYGTGQFAKTGDGRGDDTQTEAGAAIKFRISDTVLKYGKQMVDTPVFSTDDSRILPEVTTGTLLTSNEIEGLELVAGRFTAMSSQTATGSDSLTQEGATLKSANIVGGSYSFTDDFSAGLYASDVEDFWKKKYLNLNYNLPLAENQALNFDFNFYKSDDEGRALAGELDNKIWSLAAAYSIGAHKFTLAHQRSSGDTGYNYGIDGGGTIYLANSVQYSDFLGKDERSWQARYDINMATYGIPGLSFMTRYVTGDNIDVGEASDAKEHELDIEAKYVIQEGAAKDLSFRVRNAIYRANDSYDADINDFRLIVEYPLEVL